MSIWSRSQKRIRSSRRSGGFEAWLASCPGAVLPPALCPLRPLPRERRSGPRREPDVADSKASAVGGFFELVTRIKCQHAAPGSSRCDTKDLSLACALPPSPASGRRGQSQSRSRSHDPGGFAPLLSFCAPGARFFSQGPLSAGDRWSRSARSVAAWMRPVGDRTGRGHGCPR
jgi:hypothetical protein